MKNLAEVQASPGELEQYMSITAIQTKGLKRHFQELNAPSSKAKDRNIILEEAESIPNAIKGSKKRRMELLGSELKQQASSDPNIVGFEVTNL